MTAASNVANAKKAYAAFTAGDLEAALENIDPDVEWVVGGDSTVSGVYRGIEEVVGWWATLLEAGFSTMPMAFFADEDRAIVITESTTGEETSEAVDILEFRDGKLVRFRSLGDGERFERVFGVRSLR